MVPQEVALYPRLSARQNLEFFGKMYGLGCKELMQRVDEVIEYVDLAERQRDRIDTYSGGMKRRVNIAAGFLHRPPIDHGTAYPNSRTVTMEWITDPESWVALLTLTSLEVVLGIDNIVFISILAGKLPQQEQPRARRVGLLGAMLTRIALLLSLAWLIGLTRPLIEIFGEEISGRDIILIAGGLFLLAKATFEIHDKLEGAEGHASARLRANFYGVLVQIMLLDIVFSLDSVLTAVGMARALPVMVSAIVIAVAIMLFASGPISDFVTQRPTLKILALSFLLLIGVSLVAEGLEVHIPKGYIYFAMGFSVFVEMINLRLREKPETPVKLRQRYVSNGSRAKTGGGEGTAAA